MDYQYKTANHSVVLLHNKICLPSPERRLVTAQHSRFLEWDAHNEELEGGWNEAYAMDVGNRKLNPARFALNQGR